MLESIQLNVVAAINFTDYERLLNQRTVNFEIEEVYINLTRIAALQSNMVPILISYGTLISMFTAADIFPCHDHTSVNKSHNSCRECEQLTNIVLMAVSRF